MREKGRAPAPGENYNIFCIGMSFHWYYTTEPLIRTCLMDLDGFSPDEMQKIKLLMEQGKIPARDNPNEKISADMMDELEIDETDDMDDEIIDADSDDDDAKSNSLSVKTSFNKADDEEMEEKETPEDIALRLKKEETNAIMLDKIRKQMELYANFNLYLCGSECNILKKFGEIIASMQPDIMTAFNNGSFDTPIVYDKLVKYNMQSDFVKQISPIYFGDYDNKILVGEKLSKNIKISASENLRIAVFSIPGMIDTDTMIEMKKIYTREQIGNAYSLNRYLELNKLEGKEDMPINHMFDIYENAQILQNIINQLKITDNSFSPGKIIERVEKLDIANVLNKTPTGQLLIKKIYNAMDMYDIAKYCVVDAFRCQQLWCIRSIFDDKSELANLSYAPLADSFYRANGIKVRNLIGAGCYERGFMFSSNSKQPEQPIKYKYMGAWVFEPTKGMQKNIPVVGLDFASLYPSLMMTYNYSPEKIISDYNLMCELKAQGYDFQEIHTEYLHDDEAKTPSGICELAWSIRHRNVLKDEAGQKTVITYKHEKNEAGKIARIPIYGNPSLTKECLGIFPTILHWLKTRRSVVKKRVVAYNGILEALKVGEHPHLSDLILTDFVVAKAKYNRDEVPTIDTFANYEEYVESVIKNLDPLEIVFRRNIEDTKQNAMKVHMNTFYGETGNQRSPIYKSTVAMGITMSGRARIKEVYRFVSAKDYKVWYGDSCLGHTPVLIKVNGKTKYVEIKDLQYITNTTNEQTTEQTTEQITNTSNDKQYFDLKDKSIEVWSDKGWTQVKSLMKHKTNKRIYRVITHSGMVDVTEDHSLINVYGNVIKPTQMTVGTILWHKNLPPTESSNKVESDIIIPMNSEQVISMRYNTQLESAIAYQKAYHERYNIEINVVNSALTGGVVCVVYELIFSRNFKNTHLSNVVRDIIPLGVLDEPVFDIETENHHFSAGIGRLVIHNTDSLYISCPQAKLNDIMVKYEPTRDLKLLQTSIDRAKCLEYFIEIVQFTRKDINELRDVVNNMLAENTGTDYLTMAYEEVLCPVIFTGKKKYGGRKHEDKEVFNTPLPQKEMFIRGLDIIKGGLSAFVRENCLDVMNAVLDIYDTRDLATIVNEKLVEITQKKWEVKYFIRNAKYRPDKKNVCANNFMDRMRVLYDKYLSEKNIEMAKLFAIPTAGDKYKTVIVKKDALFDYAGRKITLKTADVMEYLDVYEYSQTKNSIIPPMEVNIRHYVDPNLANALARFLSYMPEFETMAKTHIETTLAKMIGKTTTKKVNTDIDKIIINEAKKYVLNIYDQLTGYSRQTQSKIGQMYKATYKQISKVQMNMLGEKISPTTKMILDTLTNQMNISNELKEQKIKNPTQLQITQYMTSKITTKITDNMYLTQLSRMATKKQRKEYR